MVLERKINFDGLTRKIQMKPLKYTELVDNNGNKIYKVTKILIILKWGGFLTHAGLDQARILGETFRVTLYPSSEDEQNGLLRDNGKDRFFVPIKTCKISKKNPSTMILDR